MALGHNLDEIPVASCVGCGLSIGNPLFLEHPYCDACDLSDYAVYRRSYGAGLPQCHVCAEPIFLGDANPNGLRHRWCDRFYTHHIRDHAARDAERIAAVTEDAIAA